MERQREEHKKWINEEYEKKLESLKRGNAILGDDEFFDSENDSEQEAADRDGESTGNGTLRLLIQLVYDKTKIINDQEYQSVQTKEKRIDQIARCNRHIRLLEAPFSGQNYD